VRERQEPWSQVYECSSLRQYRKLIMRVDMTPRRDGFVVVHSAVKEAPIERATVDTTDFAAYTSSSGLIVQCSNCRRTRREGGGETWDWVPQLVAAPRRNLSHGLCPSCDVLYYGVRTPGNR
ncbi:MAG: hypothetical protein K0R38_6819, partial [Polyangiaceae bacterium]|nr:hypothetical protein [Polyangiaceae bacterium]